MIAKTLSNLLVLRIFLIGALVGLIASTLVLNAKLEKEGRYDSVELQHQVMIEQNEDFKYCPYCGEKLAR